MNVAGDRQLNDFSTTAQRFLTARNLGWPHGFRSLFGIALYGCVQMVVTPTDPGPAAELAPQPPARPVPRRICILSEDLAGAPDEGVKKFTLSLAGALRGMHEVTVLSTRGPVAADGVRLVPAPRTFLGGRLRTALRRARPELLVYAACPSTTFFSFVRCRILRAYCPGATIVLLGLQPRTHARPQRRLVRFLAPDLVCVQTAVSARYLTRLGCATALLPSGVDTSTFRPVAADRRRALRARYGLPADAPVALHVGHLQAGRNIRVLAELAARGVCRPLLVTSTSTDREADLARELRAAGVFVLTDYQPHIEELYQLADCYVFPVESADNAIEVPLSVLEACACDLPVVTTRFGGLVRLFGETPCDALAFVDSSEALVAAVARLCRPRPGGTRALVAPYAWEAIATALLDHALGKEAPRA